MARQTRHEPVLLKEAVEWLAVREGGKYIDATIGGGGHAGEILARGGRVLGIDQDKEALKVVRRRLAERFPKGGWSLEKGNFAKIEEIARREGFVDVDGVLFDLGMSSLQLAVAKRGFSFRKEGPLDMRMDQDLGVTAADLVNSLSERQLYEVFSQMGEEQLARPIARLVALTRSVKPIETTKTLAGLVEGVYRERGKRNFRVHPATKVFMALRVVVNFEIENLKEGLPGAIELLRLGGRLVVISFHSGEDRVVKQVLAGAERQGKLRVLTEGVVVPSGPEIARNPRARSARLRAAERV